VVVALVVQAVAEMVPTLVLEAQEPQVLCRVLLAGMVVIPQAVAVVLVLLVRTHLVAQLVLQEMVELALPLLLQEVLFIMLAAVVAELPKVEHEARGELAVVVRVVKETWFSAPMELRIQVVAVAAMTVATFLALVVLES
jgi:hypothetical protein